jgi:hypothetical protein
LKGHSGLIQFYPCGLRGCFRRPDGDIQLDLCFIAFLQSRPCAVELGLDGGGFILRSAVIFLGPLSILCFACQPLVCIHEREFHSATAFEHVHQQADQAGSNEHAQAFQYQLGLVNPASSRLQEKAEFHVLRADRLLHGALDC